MEVVLNGVVWSVQIVMHPLAYGFEVNHGAHLIRIEFTSQSYDFAERVAQAVAGALAVPVFSEVD
jgi:hypothetical protein